MEDAEEYYRQKYEEVQEKLNDPEINRKVENHLKKISKLVDCGVELNFVVMPHVENYEEIQDSDDYEIPDQPTMKLRDFITHLQSESGDMDVYVDPIYLKKGVNQIIDILITTTDSKKMIVVPISNKKIN
jgi:hypothetical protein